MTTSIKNLKNNVVIRMATEMVQNDDTFIITINDPSSLTLKDLNGLRNLNGKISKTGVKFVVVG